MRGKNGVIDFKKAEFPTILVFLLLDLCQESLVSLLLWSVCVCVWVYVKMSLGTGLFPSIVLWWTSSLGTDLASLCQQCECRKFWGHVVAVVEWVRRKCGLGLLAPSLVQ